MDLIDDPAAWAEAQAVEALQALRALAPDLLAALALLLAAWAGAWMLRWLVLRFGKGLDALMAMVHGRSGEPAPRPRWSVTALAATIAFWVVVALGVIAASEQLGLRALASWLSELLGYLPRVLISGLVLFIGYLIANGLRNLVVGLAESQGFQHGATLGRLVLGLVLAFALLLALEQLGLDVDLFADIIVIAAAALFGAAAVAFGIGAADSVRNIMASHYLRRTYEPGQRVRIQGVEGEILELTPVAVLLETETGPALVPARSFLEGVSQVVEEEEATGA